ncbi:MAG: type III-A CRISPR-associated protein Cas10/Csm1 [Armatimonadota bacterium]
MSNRKGVLSLKEFEWFLCAALLHDAGKFYQRAHNEKARHWDVLAAFVEAHRNSFYDADLVKTLVSHHHESPVYTDVSDRPESIADAHTRMLAYLLSRADNLSSSERSDLDRTSGYRSRSALDSVFAQVDIGRPMATPGDGSAMKYRLGTILQGSAFPELLGAEYEHTEAEYEQHVDRFLSDFRTLFSEPYPRMADTLLHLLQKYLWCIPSDTTRERRDISLADHSRVTCALAACFYRYYEQTGWVEDAVCNDALSKASLVCGDLSGIQDYIYGTVSVGHGGVARRLRGRSFRITLLTEIAAIRILHALGLPLACKIISAGGQFYLLVPNTEHAKSALEATVSSISAWLLDNYLGELSLSMACQDLASDQILQGSSTKCWRPYTLNWPKRSCASLTR